MSSVQRSPLFAPVRLGRLSLRNKIVLAPMTRSRALPRGVPHASAPLYYAQRASGGLLISEGACVSPQGVGHPGVPGIWTDEQIDGWLPVTGAVHALDGCIIAQLWHTGRASHPSVQENRETPVGPSAIAAAGTTFTAEGLVPFVTPRALETSEVPGVVEQYARAAENALRAGFDGVELHGANGYLIDQFLHDSANQRTDEYGGSAENRCRFLFDVVAAVTAAVGADRVGLRLSPSSDFNDMFDADPAALYEHALAGLGDTGLAFIHVVEPGVSGAATADAGPIHLDSAWVRDRWRGGLICAGNQTRASAEAALERGRVDAVAFGRAYLTNPDLPERLAADASYVFAERDSFYGGDDRGYLDYPSLAAERLHDDLRRRMLAGERNVLPQIRPLGPETPVDSWALAWAVQKLREDEGITDDVPDDLSASTLREALEARAIVQLGVAWTVSGAVGEEPAGVLREQSERVRSLIRDGAFVDQDAYLASNEVFHNQIVALAGNRPLLHAFELLELRTQIAEALGQRSAAHPDVRDAYDRLVGAITGDDFERARAAILAFAAIAGEHAGSRADATGAAHPPRGAGNGREAQPAAASPAQLIETSATDSTDAVAALLEAIEARSIIEIGVAQMLRDARGVDAWRDELLQQVERLGALIDQDRFVDIARYVAENSAFHDKYVAALGNSALLRVFRALDVPNLMIQTTTRTSPTRSEIVEDYRRWARAAADGNCDEVCGAIAEYTRRVRDILTNRPDFALR
jgi:N-ethylmaleimide reductase